jgi:hypothetical protein
MLTTLRYADMLSESRMYTSCLCSLTVQVWHCHELLLMFDVRFMFVVHLYVLSL